MIIVKPKSLTVALKPTVIIQRQANGRPVGAPPKPVVVPASKFIADQASYAVELEEVATGAYQDPLIIVTDGAPFAGKSHFCGSAPGVIGVLPTEHKVRGTLLKAAAWHGKRVKMPKENMLRSGRADTVARVPPACITMETVIASKRGGNVSIKEEDATKTAERMMMAMAKDIPLDGEQPVCCQRHYYRWHVNRQKSVLFRYATDDEVKTIVIDTFGQLVEDILYANYGRIDNIIPLDKKSMNQEVTDLLNAICHKNVILTHYQSEIWKDNKIVNNKFKPKNSFKWIGHHANVMIEQERQTVKGEDGSIGHCYTLKIKDCQANPELIGDVLTNEEITFKTLALKIYPDSDPEGWE